MHALVHVYAEQASDMKNIFFSEIILCSIIITSALSIPNNETVIPYINGTNEDFINIKLHCFGLWLS